MPGPGFRRVSFDLPAEVAARIENTPGMAGQIERRLALYAYGGREALAPALDAREAAALLMVAWRGVACPADFLAMDPDHGGALVVDLLKRGLVEGARVPTGAVRLAPLAASHLSRVTWQPVESGAPSPEQVAAAIARNRGHARMLAAKVKREEKARRLAQTPGVETDE